MQDLKVTVIQTPLYWETPGANRAMLEEKIWQVDLPTDLIILPEMFTTGFTMNAKEQAEVFPGPTFKWMQQLSEQTKAVLTGSYIVKEKGNYFNRLLWVYPDGTYFYYNKRHLFRMAKENDVYSPGSEKIIVKLKGWNICPLVCYDLRFPVFSRNNNNLYDLLIYVANWPAARASAWNTLLQARAIENLSYVIGVNRIGEDGNNIPYAGNSAIVDFKGDYLHRFYEEEDIINVTLSKDQLSAFRAKFPAHLDADIFEIKV
jgi:predicted amidohydrolase